MFVAQPVGRKQKKSLKITQTESDKGETGMPASVPVQLELFRARGRMKLYTSNRLEELANQLSIALDAPLSSPLAREVIVVQSRGMARWISLRIAQISNICMNCEFPFPRAFIGRTLRAFFPAMADEEEFSVESMTWKINRLLPALAPQKEFALVKNYLDKEDGLKAFQLSEKIARLFDQYLVYRPEMLMGWERDRKENDWQAVLWRRLAGEGGSLHLARLHESLSERLASGLAESRLLERVSIFGISSLPPFYLRVFIELSRHCEVNLFSLEPSQEYHGQDLSPKKKAKLRNSLAGRGVTVAGDDFPTGNPLLTSLGRLNRDFTEVRLELDERAGFVMREQAEQFVEPELKDLLHSLQSDILHARDHGDPEHPKEEVSANDGSIQINACHSPMREIEVLYDHLLERFEQDPTLKPRDIIVMTPDIEKYGPFINAVFAYPEDSQRFIPFSVADRRPRSDSPAIQTFLSLLALPGSRYTASEVFSLLERTLIRRRFAFTDEDITLIRRWIAESGIRWGIDEPHRKAFRSPELDANTWMTGLKRFLLGYAMAGNNHTAFEGIMPYDEVEGGGAEVLGRFVSAVEALFRLTKELPAARALADWPDSLGAVIDQYFLADETEDISGLRLIRMALDQLRRTAKLVGGDQKVEFRVVRYHLQQLLDQGEQRGGFLTGGVTFCAIQPMRSVPARIICLVGMGDQDFPRRSQAQGFDLMARDRRCGDHSMRDDDRYAFLEALISARERLYISYVGRSAIDNEEIPPSVLVSELLDYLNQSFVFPNKRNARDWLTSEHRLHSFSLRYFNGSDKRLFSYSESNAAASRSLCTISDQPPARFFDQPLAEPAEETRRIELKSLIGFFANPAKHFIRGRLGLWLDDQDDALEDSEPFELNALEGYILKQELVTNALANQTATLTDFAARGVLPSGEMGAAHFYPLLNATEEFRKTVEPELRGQKPDEPLLVDLRMDLFSLTGQIESIYRGRIVQFRCATLKPKDRMRAWVSHLVKCATDPGAERETVLIGSDEVVTFWPLKDASAIIASLLEIYWRGLSRALPFFPVSSLEYARTKLLPSGSADASPLKKARQKWNGSDWKDEGEKGEKNDKYYAFCFLDPDPLDEEFESLALEIFEPMLRNTRLQR
jgi:exodeoxyribonuclease V gamma subunit